MSLKVLLTYWAGHYYVPLYQIFKRCPCGQYTSRYIWSNYGITMEVAKVCTLLNFKNVIHNIIPNTNTQSKIYIYIYYFIS